MDREDERPPRRLGEIEKSTPPQQDRPVPASFRARRQCEAPANSVAERGHRRVRRRVGQVVLRHWAMVLASSPVTSAAIAR